MTPVFLYSHSEEPITSTILSSSLDIELGIIKLSLRDLLKDTLILDEIDENGAKIEWTLPSGAKISNSNKFYLLNRVLSIPEDLFNDFAEEDKAYSISEFRAYLAFSIEAFPNCLDKPGAFGLSGNKFSLPRQWNIIKKANLDIATPIHYLGNLNFMNENDKKERWVFSTPNNYYYWKESQNSNFQNNFSFAFKKPPGVPVVCLVFGKKIEIFSYYPNDEISVENYSIIKECAHEITRLFEYNIAEILFFSNACGVSFGMISNIPYASKNKIWFSSMLSSFIKTEVLNVV